MPHKITSKLPQAGTTIFTIMSSLAVQHNAINLGQGFPDYPMSDELISLVNDAMKKGYNQYVHMNGYIPLREAIAEKIEFLYRTKIHPETNVTITPGGTYALYTALTCFLQPGDEVIVFEPAYDSYIPGIELNGAKAITIPLEFPTYKIDWTAVRKKITDKTRAIMVNSPHNPTGSVLEENDMRQLSDIVKDSDIIIVSDEVYEHLIFDNKVHESILKYPDLLNRSFVCFSFGKVYNCTGWKLGYCIAPEWLMQEFRKVHQYNCFSCDSPKQVALAQFLPKREEYLELGKQLQKKRDYFISLMSGTRLKPLPSYGSYFQIYSYQGISEESERDFAIRITKEKKVASIPVSVFYREATDHRVVRFCFSKIDTTLEEAARRLATI